MLEADRRVVVVPRGQVFPEHRRPRRLPVMRMLLWTFGVLSLAVMLGLGSAGLSTWHWVDRNLLHWGVQESGTQTVNQVELLRRVRAFELVTVKDTYASQAHVTVSEVFNAGSNRVPLPGWLAGQQLQTKGTVTVTAGVDLAQVRQDDVEIMQHGKDAQVVIRVPAPQILGSELVPNTLQMSTSAGILTQVGQAVGLSNEAMRNRAADDVLAAAREQALKQGILDAASHEAERRLGDFLNSLPQSGHGHVSYLVVTRAPAQS